MKTSPYESIDYQHIVLLLMREKFPVFLLGLLITSYLSFFVISKIGIRKDSAKVPEVKKMQIQSIKTYTVQQNDDLWGIAEKMYGSGFNATDIALANNLAEPYTLIENQILIIPSIAPKKPTQGDITEQAAQTKKITEYVVLPGEYLWQIAEKIYGDGNQMSKLIDANRIPYPYNVETDQKLLVP
ncbi:MAG: LysM peptidoglycan-binding domain-containing protein [bacterium]